MFSGTVALLFGLFLFVTAVALCTAWAVTVVQVASVPDQAWQAVHDDRRTWLMVVVLGGPPGALAFWLTTWPQLSAAAASIPVVPPTVADVLSTTRTPPATKSPARKAPASKSPARKAPARRPAPDRDADA